MNVRLLLSKAPQKAKIEKYCELSSTSG